MNFEGFVSNEKIINDIEVAFNSNRLPHAIILEGEEGLGRHTLSSIIAKSLVCKSDTDKPCNNCSACSKARQNIHPDIFDYKPKGTLGSFSVKTVREIIADAYVQPNEAQYKIYILNDAQCMNASAQNALLKILEEPPKYVVFILTCTSKSLLLPTVLSRSVCYSLEGAINDDAVGYIMSKSDDITKEQASIALSSFAGNIGKALESIEKGSLDELTSLCDEICSCIVSPNEYDLIKVLSPLQNDRQRVMLSCELLLKIFRDALMLSEGASAISGRISSAELLSTNATKKSLLELIKNTEIIKQEAQRNANKALLITRFSYLLRGAVKK